MRPCRRGDAMTVWLQRELNPLSDGYEPSEIPFLHSAKTKAASSTRREPAARSPNAARGGRARGNGSWQPPQDRNRSTRRCRGPGPRTANSYARLIAGRASVANKSVRPERCGARNYVATPLHLYTRRDRVLWTYMAILLIAAIRLSFAAMSARRPPRRRAYSCDMPIDTPTSA